LHLEVFALGDSTWHRTDPRVKLLGTAGFAVAVATATRFTPLVFALALAAATLWTARLDRRKLWIRLAAVNGFVLFLWLFLPFTTPGEALAQWGWLTVRREGLELAAAITLKTNAIIMVTIALLGTSTIFDLVHGLVHLRVPRRLVQLFFFCFRYITVIHEEYVRLRSSMRIRCFHPRTSIHTYRSMAYLVAMLFVRSYERSERIYQAMVLRGFSGTFWTLNHFHMHRRDWALSAGIATAVGLVLALQWGRSVL